MRSARERSALEDRIKLLFFDVLHALHCNDMEAALVLTLIAVVHLVKVADADKAVELVQRASKASDA